MDSVTAIERYALNRSKRNTILKRYGIVTLFLLPFLAAFICFFVIPFIYGIKISLMDFKFSAPGKSVYNAEPFLWYRMIFGDLSLKTKSAKVISSISANFWKSFANSFIFSLIMVPIAVLVPLGLAILVNIKPPGYKVFRAMIYLPSIVPLTAAGTIFTILFMDKEAHGLVNEFFNLNIRWMSDIWFKFNIGSYIVEVPYAWIPIFLMCFWGGWGSNFIILSAGLQNVPKSLYEAADIDGCSNWKKISNVTIPGIKGQLVLCIFTTIIGYLGLYGQNYVLSGGGPGVSTLPGSGKTMTIIYFIQDIVANNSNFRESLYGLGAAASIIYALLVSLISGFQMWCTRERKPGNRNSEAFAKWYRIR